MPYRLVIGNKNTSSWSLRPWLALTQAGIPFREVSVRLRQPDTKTQILQFSPSGKVPALLIAGAGKNHVVWDSLAILEFIAEAHPEAEIWPGERATRAHARAVSAEMHSSFQALREHCPMDFMARTPMPSLPDAVAADVRRIVSVWKECCSRRGSGAFLFGHFCAADAMYAPVVSRFRTYLPDLAAYGDDGTARAYIAAVAALPGMQLWEEGARAELVAPS